MFIRLIYFICVVYYTEGEKMSSLIAEKYANLLTREDVIRLFELLVKRLRNKVEAAKVCGLERKTIYGWETTKEIRLNTKRKVLAALIENFPEETLELLTEKSAQATVDILRNYLFALYEKAIIEKDPQNFLQLTSRFEEAKKKYAGLIADYLKIEVGDMLELLPERASELGVQFQPAPLGTVKLSELSTIIPHLFKALSIVDLSVPRAEIAKTFNLPIDFIENLSRVLYEYYVPTRIFQIREKFETASTAGLQKQPAEALTQLAWQVEQLQFGMQTFLGAN